MILAFIQSCTLLNYTSVTLFLQSCLTSKTPVLYRNQQCNFICCERSNQYTFSKSLKFKPDDLLHVLIYGLALEDGHK